MSAALAGPPPPSRRRIITIAVLLVTLTGLSAWRLWPREAPALAQLPDGRAALEFSGPTMGAHYRVTVVAPLSADDQAAIEALIARELDAADREMSTWREDSEVSRFNRHASTEPFPVSSGLLEVVAIANAISEASYGALDITVAPLAAAWGFGPGGRKDSTPDPETLLALRQQTGWSQLEINLSAQTLRKNLPSITLELSAVAPGYVADRIAAGLVELGFRNHLVDIGGEIRASAPASIA